MPKDFQSNPKRTSKWKTQNGVVQKHRQAVRLRLQTNQTKRHINNQPRSPKKPRAPKQRRKETGQPTKHGSQAPKKNKPTKKNERANATGLENPPSRKKNLQTTSVDCQLSWRHSLIHSSDGPQLVLGEASQAGVLSKGKAPLCGSL